MLDKINSSDVHEEISHYCPWLRAGRLLPRSARDSAHLWKVIVPRLKIRGKPRSEGPCLALACPAVKQGYSAERWC